MSDRRDETSVALNEIRTVRSRAMSARERLAGRSGLTESRPVPAQISDEGYVPPTEQYYRDRDADEMDALLAEFIDKTAKFAGRGGDRKAGHRPGRF